jgi:hypothetical protein
MDGMIVENAAGRHAGNPGRRSGRWWITHVLGGLTVVPVTRPEVPNERRAAQLKAGQIDEEGSAQ